MVPFLFGVKLAVSYVNMAYWFTTNRRSYVATANKDDKTSLQSGIASARAWFIRETGCEVPDGLDTQPWDAEMKGRNSGDWESGGEHYEKMWRWNDPWFKFDPPGPPARGPTVETFEASVAAGTVFNDGLRRRGHLSHQVIVNLSAVTDAAGKLDPPNNPRWYLGPKRHKKKTAVTERRPMWWPRRTPLEAYWELREWITGRWRPSSTERNPIPPAGKRKPPVHPSVIRAKDIPRDRHWRADRILEEPDRIKVVAGLRDHGHGPVDKCIKEGPDYIDAARFLNELLVGNKHHDNGPDKRQEWERRCANQHVKDRRRHLWRSAINAASPARPYRPFVIVSPRDTGYRHPPDWSFWLSFDDPGKGFRGLNDYKIPPPSAFDPLAQGPAWRPTNRKGVAVGFPLRSPFWDRTEYKNGPRFYGTAADKGFAAVLREEKLWLRTRRNKRFERADFAEPESEEGDIRIVAAYYKLQHTQMLLSDKSEADAENAAMLDDAKARLQGTDRRLFEMARDGLVQQEIAANLEISQPTVSRRLEGILKKVQPA